MEKALLVTVKVESEKDNWPLEDAAYELEELAVTSGAEVVNSITCTCDRPAANLFIGSGKADEIAFLCQADDIETVIFSHDLSGTQQRNLEEAVGRKVIDRTQLILDIFARHAKSPEGKAQVELAQLEYLLPRLTGKGVVLSRLGGGIGTRGPGEQKLETDRRRIRKRIDRLKEDLQRLMLHRHTVRKRRQENSAACVALVGYTNAGKSTLINALTNADQRVQDSLFTTLDPVSKGIRLPNGENIVLSDTVGFLQNLPHNLIEAFKATLEEVVEADLLIHVLDVSHPRFYEHSRAVSSVLQEIGAADKPLITALNKIDLMDDKIWLNRLSADFPEAVCISAKSGQNLEELLNSIQKKFEGRMALVEVVIPHTQMGLVDLIYREGRVESVKYLAEGIQVKARLPKTAVEKYLKGII
ncbi:MAG: GTPase HflX [Candidatus Omnitrophota bacterium]